MATIEKPDCRIRARKRVGRCYELAARGQLKAPNWVLIHGLVRGPEGKQIEHAWLQHGATVYDPVPDRKFSVDEYSTAYDAKMVREYGSIAAATLMSKSGHSGPWE